MKAVIQRVNYCKLRVDSNLIVDSKKGLVVLFGIEKSDQLNTVPEFLTKILNMRIFSNNAGKFDFNIKDIDGDLVIIPQFTLFADTSQGRRPTFFDAMGPKDAINFFEQVCKEATKLYAKSYFGVFGADMKVELENDGPVTIII